MGYIIYVITGEGVASMRVDEILEENISDLNLNKKILGFSTKINK